MPANKPSRWKRTQIAEKMQSITQELRSLAFDLADYRCSTHHAAASWMREVATYLADVADLLAGELPGWEAARHKSNDLAACAEILKEWAAHPTDHTGQLSRAAQLRGVADSVDAFCFKLL